MESTVSVSKGVFLFPNGFKKSKTSKKKPISTFFQKLFKEEPWYVTYRRNWNFIEGLIKELHHRTYNVLLDNIVKYIKSLYEESELISLKGIIPSATLLTGVNQPDHASQFTALVDKIRDDVTPHIAMVNSQDALTIKHLVENVVWQLIRDYDITDSSDEENSVFKQGKKLKKSQCTMRLLKKWYAAKYVESSPKKKNHVVSTRLLVIIVPDFEGFNSNILQDFVMIISSYVSCLPIVFIFGVATSVSALHKSFPYHVSSKLLIKVFQSVSSPVYMNQVFEEIFLTHRSPFHLSGKALELLTDVFLFYDFSVTELIQSVKYYVMDHYYGDNVKSLCCEQDKVEEAITNLTEEDIENIRRLLSFRPFLESQECQTKLNLFEDDDFFKKILYKEIKKIHNYLNCFYVCLRLFSTFVKDLPKNIFGNSVREIYAKCAAECITNTEAFRECMQLLSFQSQFKLVENIRSALKIINSSLQNASPSKSFLSPSKDDLNGVVLNDNNIGENFIKTIRVHLLIFLRQIESAHTEASVLNNIPIDKENSLENVSGNRYKLKQTLLRATKVDRLPSEFEMVRSRFISFLKDVFVKGLQPPHTQTFYEIYFLNDISNVKKQIIGSPRGSLHTALSNPVHYLQCTCCHLPSSESVVNTLPDVCLLYKLHRECGKHINLYDWLQAFATVLRPDEDDDKRHHDSSIQMRFTRAVAELQFLGFIKSSKRKTDHVIRLTW